MAAEPITPLMPGAGPPPTRIPIVVIVSASVSVSRLLGWRILNRGDRWIVRVEDENT